MQNSNDTLTWEVQYLDIVNELLEKYDRHRSDPDRTGVGRTRLFDRTIKVDLSTGIFPVVTTRKINYYHGLDELRWMISGSSNINQLEERSRSIWKAHSVQENHIDDFLNKQMKVYLDAQGVDPETDEVRRVYKNRLMTQHLGSIGTLYGKVWRHNPSGDENPFLPMDSLRLEDIPSDKFKQYEAKYKLIEFHSQDKEQIPKFETFAKYEYLQSGDQLGELIRGIKIRPYSARHILSTWIPKYVPFESVLSPQENVLIGKGSLTPCHVLSQFFVEKSTIDLGSDFISLKICQRSCDIALGVCTNLVFYAALLRLVAKVTGLRAKHLIWSGGDVHMYENHYLKLQLQVRNQVYTPPSLVIKESVSDLFSLTKDDLDVKNYLHNDVISFPLAV